METKIKVRFWKSKTKIGALLAGLGPVLITLGGMLEGSIGFSTGLSQLTAPIAAILIIVGIRDMPFINKK